MNTSQRFVLGIGVFLILLLGLFPPWEQVSLSSRGSLTQPVGHAFILSPPPRPNTSSLGLRIATEQLVIQVSLVAIASVMGVLLFKRGKEKP